MDESNNKSILYGCGAAFLGWGVQTAVDALDELVLDSSFSLLTLFLFPLFMLIWYIKHYIKQHPSAKKLRLWFLGYTIMFAVLGFIIGWLMDQGVFIPQHTNHEIIDFNGAEYVWFPLTGYVGFVVLCIVFHIIYGIYGIVGKRKGHK